MKIIGTVLLLVLAGCMTQPVDPFIDTSQRDAILAKPPPSDSLQRLSVPAMWGEIVVEFSLTNDYARAYQLLATNSSSQSEGIEFDSGAPADLTLQTDAAGEIVHVLKIGGFYIGNYFARGTREDGSIVTNNPVAILNGTTQTILNVWLKLGKTNKSFRIQKLDIDYEANKSIHGTREELARP